ncbi:MAG: hypothetical protein ACYCSG_05070 [Thermoplasmataceae archaeon]
MSISPYTLGIQNVFNNNACVKGKYYDLWGWCVAWGTATWTYEYSYSTFAKTGWFNTASGNTFIHTNTGGNWGDSASWSGISSTESTSYLHFTGVLTGPAGPAGSMTIISKLFPNGSGGYTTVQWYYYYIGGGVNSVTLYVPITIGEDA